MTPNFKNQCYLRVSSHQRCLPYEGDGAILTVDLCSEGQNTSYEILGYKEFSRDFALTNLKQLS